MFTIVGKRRDDGRPGCLLSVENHSKDSSVEIDGDRVLVLDEATLAGLSALVELAHRGRDHFRCHAEGTDNRNDEDMHAADKAWHLAERAIRKIRGTAS